MFLEYPATYPLIGIERADRGRLRAFGHHCGLDPKACALLVARNTHVPRGSAEPSPGLNTEVRPDRYPVPMGIGVVDRKLLWGRANDQCAFPGCLQALTVNLDDLESQVLGTAGAVIGEEAHIRSGRVDGPRHQIGFPDTEIDTYRNLLLLCPTHHAIVDKENGKAYSVEDLEAMRETHEQAMRIARTDTEETRRRVSERLAASIQVWEDKASLNEWQTLTWSLNQAIPALPDRLWAAVFDTTEWLLGKDWPPAFPKVREAFFRFAHVLSAFAGHLMETFEQTNGGSWRLDRAYKRIDGWDEVQYWKLMEEWRENCTVTWCLVIELTQAANLVIRAVREEIDPFYRWEEGVLLARDGDGIVNNMFLARWEYEDHVWGSPLASLDLVAWRTGIRQQAQDRGVRMDELNPHAALLSLRGEV